MESSGGTLPGASGAGARPARGGLRSRWRWAGLLIVILAAGALTAVLLAAAPGPSPRDRRWQDDIAYLARTLPQVRAAGLGPVSRTAWDAAATRLEARVPRLTDGQIIVGMARMVAMLHDDETELVLPAEPIYRLEAQWFGGGLYLLAVPRAESGLTVQDTTKVLNGGAHPMGTPDITIAPSLRQVLAGDDPVLAAALSYRSPAG